MVKSTVVAGFLLLSAVGGWIIGTDMVNPTQVPQQIVIVSDPSEMPSPATSPTPAVVPQPAPERPKPSYVPPRMADPDPTNPSNGGNVGGGFNDTRATKRPSPTP
jgi:hypothetical protein